jgi:hypothetical protein
VDLFVSLFFLLWTVPVFVSVAVTGVHQLVPLLLEPSGPEPLLPGSLGAEDENVWKWLFRAKQTCAKATKAIAVSTPIRSSRMLSPYEVPSSFACETV